MGGNKPLTDEYATQEAIVTDRRGLGRATALVGREPFTACCLICCTARGRDDRF